jgi:alpha-amylase/alpha-mannosidase (GH57 family)
MSDLALCIHGHFYQPPRENPFTGDIPVEPGAEPFRNFNEKIHTECYKPNADLGNFELISFNFGPTLAGWLKSQFPTTHDRIVTSDHYHQRAFGVGNGIAQAYNHTILPLASHRDKITQIAWGIADFQHRFGHEPEGMWLPEMAVDMDSLVALESMGVRYTLLCPHQVRHLNGDWVDSKRPYYIRLPKNRQITVFLRDEELSNRLAFDPGLTEDARIFAQWSRNTVRTDNGLFIIATDGETFGHHQQNRQYFLESFLRAEAPKVGFQITTPAGYLRAHPPTDEVVLEENTAWSCAHGVARWSTGCACTPGNQNWKPRLRTAMDRLAGGLNALYQSECRSWIGKPWALRNSYISVMLGRTDSSHLLQQFSSAAIPSDAVLRLTRLLDAQRYCQAMYTSCGWFFEDLSRIETRNNIGYASMAIEQVRIAMGVDLSADFRSDLAAARSWITDETGQDIYDRIVSQRRI